MEAWAIALIGVALIVGYEIWAAITKKNRTISQFVWAWPKWAQVSLAIFIVVLFAHLFLGLWGPPIWR